MSLLALSLGAPAVARASTAHQGGDFGIVVLQNDQIEVRANQRGLYTIGTLGGDPATGDDDGRRLVYGHGGGAFTSFNTVRIVSDGRTRDFPLLGNVSIPPRVEGGVLTMVWQFEDLTVTQTLSAANNPYTNRSDTIRIALTATNAADQPLAAGLRIMIDTMIGDNDYAPFFVPGAGNFDTEHEFVRDEVPVYWKAFEAPDYDPASLKGQGIVTGLDATPPDRFVFASWPRVKSTVWEYEIDEGASVGDSAVAMYWEPQQLAAGASTTWVTYYGLAGVGGGNAWIDAPVNITSEEPEFATTLWVTNLSDQDFTGGEATIILPPGLRLASDETERKPMPTVPVSGGGQSVTWRLVGEGSVDADYAYSATVNFQTGSGPLSASATVHYRFIAPALATPTLEPTATATSTPGPVPPITPPPAAPEGRFPWPWLLIPLVGLPLLLLLLLRRQPARPATRVPPPRVPRTAPEPDFSERPAGSGPVGANVTHGRKTRDVHDSDEYPPASSSRS